MRVFGLFSIVMAGLLASGNAAAEHFVTFVVPVNLQDLSPTIPRIAVHCKVHIYSPSYNALAKAEVPVVNGEVATTIELKVALREPSAARYTYDCTLYAIAYDNTMLFVDNPGAYNYLSPKPVPLTGAFVW